MEFYWVPNSIETCAAAAADCGNFFECTTSRETAPTPGQHVGTPPPFSLLQHDLTSTRLAAVRDVCQRAARRSSASPVTLTAPSRPSRASGEFQERGRENPLAPPLRTAGPPRSFAAPTVSAAGSDVAKCRNHVINCSVFCCCHQHSSILIF